MKSQPISTIEFFVHADSGIGTIVNKTVLIVALSTSTLYVQCVIPRGSPMRGPYETPCPRQTPSRCTHLRSRMHRARTCRCSNFVPSSAHDSDNAAQRAHRVPTSTPRRPEAASIRVPEPSAASTSAAAEVNATNRTAGLPATEDFYLQQPKPLRPLPWYHYKVERKAHDTAPSDLLMSRVAMVRTQALFARHDTYPEEVCIHIDVLLLGAVRSPSLQTVSRLDFQ